MSSKYKKKPLAAILTAAVAVCLFAACSKLLPQTHDAGVIMREAESNAEKMESCNATYKRVLAFYADNKKYDCTSSDNILYISNPFTLKSTQSFKDGDSQSGSESYTVTSGDKLWYYCKSGTNWQKTEASDLDKSPLEQIDILRLLKSSESFKYVRTTTYASQNVYKIEVKFKSEILRSTIEDITDKTGMSKNSKTIVQTLLDSAPDIYGYCYINNDSGNIVHIEVNIKDAVNSIFKNIDGSSVKINAENCSIYGDVTGIGNKVQVALPEDARNASNVQAYG